MDRISSLENSRNGKCFLEVKVLISDNKIKKEVTCRIHGWQEHQGYLWTSDFEGDSYFNVLASYRRTWLNSLGGEWRNDVQFGQAQQFRSEFYQPLSVNRYIFVAPIFEYNQYLQWVFQDGTPIARYNNRSTDIELDLGSQFTKYGEFRVGLMAGPRSFTLNSGPPSLAPSNGEADIGAVRARLRIDQLDSVKFPRSGYYATAEILDSEPGLGARDDYTRWDANLLYAISFGADTVQLAYQGWDDWLQSAACLRSVLLWRIPAFVGLPDRAVLRRVPFLRPVGVSPEAVGRDADGRRVCRRFLRGWSGRRPVGPRQPDRAAHVGLADFCARHAARPDIFRLWYRRGGQQKLLLLSRKALILMDHWARTAFPGRLGTMLRASFDHNGKFQLRKQKQGKRIIMMESPYSASNCSF